MSVLNLARNNCQFKTLSSRLLLLAFNFSTTTKTTAAPSRSITSTTPPPIRVSLTESAGRGVFATRRIGAGDIIHSAKPFLAHPSLSCVETVCYYCLKKTSKTIDRNVSFCSEECKNNSKDFYEIESRADWSTFNDYCWSRGRKYPLLVKRLACMVASGATRADSLDILQPAGLSQQMILEMEEEFELLSRAFSNANITKDSLTSQVLTKQWYTSVLARIRINAFRVEYIGGSYEDLLASAAASIESEAGVGNAVYIVPSLYNHDCDPNTHIIWINSAEARLKALRDVEEGEELRICYIDASMGHDARQALLYQGFGFNCNCNRCSSGD
ncbi:hypothetical protein ACFE04_021366 [Oxalis oulophora]